MKYGTLNSLHTILQNLQSDAALVGYSVAGLMIIINVLAILFDSDTTVGAHQKRWEKLRVTFLCAALIAAGTTLVTFGRQLGGALTA